MKRATKGWLLVAAGIGIAFLILIGWADDTTGPFLRLVAAVVVVIGAISLADHMGWNALTDERIRRELEYFDRDQS